MTKLLLTLLIASTVGVLGCTQEDEGGSASNGIGVPKLTGDMYGAQSLAFESGKTAPTGYLDLSTAMGSGNSGLAGTVQMLYMFKGMGLLTDIFTCYGQAFVNGGVVPTDGTQKIIEINDTDLTDNGGVDESARSKMQITVSSGVVQNFKMYVCDKGTGSFTQNIYLSYNRTNDTMTVTTRYIDPDNDGGGTGDGGLRITGTGDMSGSKWVTKDFSVSFADDGATNRYQFNLDLTASTFMVDGKMYGGTSFETYAKADYAIDGNSYYIGDGSASYVSGGSFITSWSGVDGSTVTPATGGKHYTAVASGTPSGSDPGDINSWGTGEDWDCSGTADHTYNDDEIPQSIGLAAYQCFSNID